MSTTAANPRGLDNKINVEASSTLISTDVAALSAKFLDESVATGLEETSENKGATIQTSVADGTHSDALGLIYAASNDGKCSHNQPVRY